MPDSRAIPVSGNAVAALLTGLVDYAGLFPPAALPMCDAVRHYAEYRSGAAAFMLGRFVCAASKLPELSEQSAALPPESTRTVTAHTAWQISAIGSGTGPELQRDLQRIAEFNDRHAGTSGAPPAMVVNSLEVRVTSPDDMSAVAELVGKRFLVFAELPAAQFETLMPHVARTGLAAKVRTGGVTEDAFPTAESVVTFLRAVVANSVPAKATAGLHHPLRGDFRLTYAPDAACGSMFGFLNMFLTAALASTHAPDAQLLALLRESNPSAFRFHADRIVWRHAESEITFDQVLLAHTRQNVLLSFGSCSFTEPVSELHAMGVPSIPVNAATDHAATDHAATDIADRHATSLNAAPSL